MTPLAHGPQSATPWDWHAHPDVWLLIATLVGLYVLAIKKWGPSEAPDPEHPVGRRKAIFYGLGVASMWIGADWPMHEISENYLLSVHMVQHMLFTFVGPPLLLMGLPAWMLRKVLAPAAAMRVVRWLTRPLIALVVFNAVVAISHWPTLVNLSLEVELVHFIVHSVLVVTAVMMWWPVVAPLPETARLSDPAKMLYLFAQSILPTVPASFLTFADGTIYEFYANVPRLWGMSVVEDQQIAGLIMKIGGGLLLWSIIAVLFFKWSAREESGTAEEVAWDDFERELQALNLRK